jgi:hypothetical protein
MPTRQHESDAVLTSLLVPTALHARAKATAKRLNWTMGELMRVALESWLNAHRGEGSRI